jgi:hypothetical protein
MNLAAIRRSRRIAPSGIPTAQRPTWRLRTRVLLHRWLLDGELARACPQGETAEHRLRAAQLADPRHRRRLAHSLRRVVAKADDQPPLLSSVVPIRRAAVAARREALLGIAERLEGQAPISATALARVETLLRDGTGPLYNGFSQRNLGEALWWIADASAERCPPHEWICPVLTGPAPERVVWTCAQCGESALSGDAAVRPA